MKARELKILLAQVDDNADIEIVSVTSDVDLVVDDIAPIIVPSNIDHDSYYLYTKDANKLCEG